MLLHVREHRPSHDPFAWSRDVDRVLSSFFAPPPRARRRPTSAFVVARDENGVTLTAEVPGVDPSAIAVHVEGRTLTVSGKREPEPRRDGHYRLRERSFGAFSETFQLGDQLDAAAIDATCRHGVLTIRIPNRIEAKPRQIEVTVG
jgi:HSP20 family protein